MAYSTVVKHSHDTGSVQMIDGTGTPLTHNTRLDNADFTMDGLRPSLRTLIAYARRGAYTSLRKGAPEPITGSWSQQMTDFTEATTGTGIDFVLGTGGHSARATTAGTSGRIPGDAITCDIQITIEGSDYGDASDHVFTLKDCAVVLGFSEGEPITITYQYTCYGDVEGDIEATRS